jgi:excisionase family DNA binding protein
MEREYFSKKQLSEYLGTGERTINEWMKSRALPHYRIGGKILRFKRSEVDGWFEQFQVTEADPVDSIVDDVMQKMGQQRRNKNR